MGIARGGIAGRVALYCAAIATVFGIAATVVATLQPDTPNPIGLVRARTAIYGVAAFVIVMFNSDAPPAFIYFRF